MKKLNTIFTLALLGIFILCVSCGCDSDNNETPDFVGIFTWEEWQVGAGWSDYSASDYAPDAEYLYDIQSNLNLAEYSVVIFGSNWCHKDCESMMPRMIKLLTEGGIKLDQITIYGLNRGFRDSAAASVASAIAQYGIKYVPTLVVLRNGSIVGTPFVFEADVENWDKTTADFFKVI